MLLNLTNWLKQPQLHGHSLLVNASEDCLPMLNSVIELVAALLTEADAEPERHSLVVDRFFDFALVKDIIESRSLFARGNLIILNFKTKPNLAQQQQLQQLIAQHNRTAPNTSDFLVLSCDKLDKKDLNSEWVKLVLSGGMLLSLSFEVNVLKAWVKYLLNKRSLTIEEPALELLLNLNQNNLTQLYQETQKLSLFFNASATISLELAKPQLLDNANYNVYALAAAYLQGNCELCQKIFTNLCLGSDDIILIMWQVAEDLRKLLKIKGLQKTLTDFRQIAAQLRIWGEGINYFKLAAKRLDYVKLVNYFAELATIDLVVKGLVSGDASVLLERLLLKLCLGTS